MKLNSQFWYLEPANFDFVLDIKENKWKNKKEIKHVRAEDGSIVPDYILNYKNYERDIPCKTYKKAKRYIKKHNEIPKGTKFRLSSKYIHCDRYLCKK